MTSLNTFATGTGIEGGLKETTDQFSETTQSGRSAQINFAKAMEEARATTVTEPAGLKAVEKISPANQAVKPTDGDVILKGLQSGQHALDPQNAMAGDIPYDFKSLLELQQKVAKYSITTELTSKIAGKLVQTTDTLLKG